MKAPRIRVLWDVVWHSIKGECFTIPPTVDFLFVSVAGSANFAPFLTQ